MSAEKLAEAHKNLEQADQLTTLTWTRWSTDWLNATPLYEKAGSAFRAAKKLELAKQAFEKASIGQERQNGQWQAAKHMETAGGIAVELRDLAEVERLFRSAGELYQSSGSGRSQAGADAYAKGARALEDQLPDEAVKLYQDACALLEDDGREFNAGDIYRSAAALYLKLHRYSEAAAMFLKIGAAAGSNGSNHAQAKAYLGAIIIYLSAGDLGQARKCCNDCTRVDSFLSSPQCELAEELLQACQAGDAEQLETAVKSPEISHLETMLVRLARQLPAQVGPTGMQQVAASGQEDKEEEEDGDDLT